MWRQPHRGEGGGRPVTALTDPTEPLGLTGPTGLTGSAGSVGLADSAGSSGLNGLPLHVPGRLNRVDDQSFQSDHSRPLPEWAGFRPLGPRNVRQMFFSHSYFFGILSLQRAPRRLHCTFYSQVYNKSLGDEISPLEYSEDEIFHTEIQ